MLWLLNGVGDISMSLIPFRERWFMAFTVLTFDWHTLGRFNSSLCGPWINISKSWKSVEVYAHFSLGNGSWFSFWHDPWNGWFFQSLIFGTLIVSHGIYFLKAIKRSWGFWFQLSSWSFVKKKNCLLEVLSVAKAISLEYSQKWCVEDSGSFSVKKKRKTFF